MLWQNVTDSSTIHESNAVAIFPLSEKVVGNIKQPEEMGLMSHSTSSRHMERFTQLWQSEPKKSVKGEMKGGNWEHRRKKSIFIEINKLIICHPWLHGWSMFFCKTWMCNIFCWSSNVYIVSWMKKLFLIETVNVWNSNVRFGKLNKKWFGFQHVPISDV